MQTNTPNNTMKLKHLSIASAMLLLFISSCGDPIELKLNVAKGDTFACVVKMDQKIETKAMGISMNIDQQMEINQTMLVEGVEGNGDVTFKNTMDRFYIKQSMPMMGMPINIEFDTDHPDKSGAMVANMGQYFSKMKGLTYIIQMDSHGKLIKSNMNDVFASLGLDSLSQQGGSNSNNNADQYISQLPEKAVKKGDSYEVELHNVGAAPFGIKNIYTVKDISESVVTLDLKTEFLPNDGKDVNDISMEVKGTQTGVVEIDRKTGMTIKSDIKQDLEMTVSSNGMQMPMKTKGTVVFTSVKK